MQHLRLSFLCSLPLLAAAAGAQDLLGVTWSGQVSLIDSNTGAATPIGTGLFGQNALTRDANGVFWSTHRLGASSTTWTYHLTTVDPSTGAATIAFPGIDIRGLASAGGNLLYAIEQTSTGTTSVDLLSLVDTTTGAVTRVGPIGFSGLQGLALHLGTLYAWDITQGLIVVDTTTGAGLDPFPGVGGPSGLQSLCSHPDGRLLVGGGSTNSLYVVDTTTGATTLVGTMTGTSDIRGIEPIGGWWTRIGQGCNGSFGQVDLTVSGTLTGTGSVTTTSTNHAPGSLGVLVLGLSTTSSGGIPLPFLLDPILGTNGCNLFVSVDATQIGFTSAVAPATLQFTLAMTPAAAGVSFHAQHACFEAVPGGLSVSNGVSIHIAP
jgi:WD40 repeat protein